jgi:hemoglobin
MTIYPWPSMSSNHQLACSQIESEQSMNRDISEARISTLVDAFYAKVRLDPEIGPIFNAIVEDWPEHLTVLKDFWSTVLLTTGRYKGDPMMRHLGLGLDPQHFERWLALFAETAQETFPADTASYIVEKSRGIARNLQDATACLRAKH